MMKVLLGVCVFCFGLAAGATEVDSVLNVDGHYVKERGIWSARHGNLVGKLSCFLMLCTGPVLLRMLCLLVPKY